MFGKNLFKFYLDELGEYRTLLGMLGGQDASNTVNRADQYGIPADIASKVKYGKDCPELKFFLHQKYKEFSAELKQSLKFHKKFWKKNSPFYKEKIERILGHKMPTYSIRLNIQTGGISNWSGTNISINAFEYLQRFKTGHMIRDIIWESMLSQTFIDIRKKHSKKVINDFNVWGISELTATIGIYQTDISPTSVWDIGYKELVLYQNKIRELYRNRKNFEDYLDKVVEYFKKNPLEGK
ncbi:MAG TPA: hypothetical protein PKJ33_00580 [Alphaproteobacteria bacterium]|nr:hypothetical protein [Alphaproteobacteria bacterium]